MTNHHSRPPVVAGSFYPADPRRLSAEVTTLLASVAIEMRSSPKALIAPHAGYVYSGPIAAAAFATVHERAGVLTRIVLIGPAHYAWVPGIAVSTVAVFETPLGPVAVDQAALAAISDRSSAISALRRRRTWSMSGWPNGAATRETRPIPSKHKTVLGNRSPTRGRTRIVRIGGKPPILYLVDLGHRDKRYRRSSVSNLK